MTDKLTEDDFKEFLVLQNQRNDKMVNFSWQSEKRYGELKQQILQALEEREKFKNMLKFLDDPDSIEEELSKLRENIKISDELIKKLFSKITKLKAENEELKKFSKCPVCINGWSNPVKEIPCESCKGTAVQNYGYLKDLQQKATQGERLIEELEKIIKDADKNTKYFDVEETRGYDCCIGDIKSILNQSKEPTA